MVVQVSTVYYGYEEQQNGKLRLQMRRDEEPWREISKEHRREFQNAVNELIEAQSVGGDVMDVWNSLDYDLPETPWDWLREADEDYSR